MLGIFRTRLRDFPSSHRNNGQEIFRSLLFYSLPTCALRGFGQNVSCTEVATLDCFVGAITGKVQVSYWTTAEKLKLDRTQKSARTLPSVSVPPWGMNSWLTFRCLNSNCSLLRGVNQ